MPICLKRPIVSSREDRYMHILFFGLRYPEGDRIAGGGQHHVLWIELNALHGGRVVSLKNFHFLTGGRIPNVNFTVGAAAENEL